ncbi:MAG: LysE family translocator [Pseudomonadota bacterium]
MPTEVLLALIGFAFVTSITPGPNNIMLLASGVNYGLRRSVPHMLGIGFGFIVMLLGVGAGLGTLLHSHPWLHDALKLASVAYMLWLAWAIATSGPVARETAPTLSPSQTKPAAGSFKGRPMTFLQAALFQWVNPKAWAMALTAMAVYRLPDTGFESVVMIALVFGAINLPCVSVWTGFGVALRRLLQDPRRVRVFNLAMAALLVLSFLPLVLEPGSF